VSVKQHHSEIVAFATVVVLLGIIMFFYYLLNAGINQKELEEIRNLVSFFRSILPEGEPLYTKALSFAEQSYRFAEYLKRNYDSAVSVLLAFFKGELSYPIWLLFAEAGVYYIIALGILKALSLKSAYLLLAVSVVSGLIVLVNPRIFKTLYVNLLSIIYDPFKDKDIKKVLKILLSNPVPASISHHNAFKGGLFQHSLEVAIRTAEKLPEEKQREGFLAGLLHDIGKIKLYRTVCDDRCNYERLNVSQEKANKLTLLELSREFHINVPKDKKIWDTVKKIDREITEKELREANFKVDRNTLIEALRRLNINGVESSKYDGWCKKELPFVVVLAHALNTKVSEILLRKDPLLPIDTKPDFKGVHVIAYARPYDDFIVREVNGKKADDLGLFDAKIGVETFRGVYLIKKEVIPEELLLKWGDTNFNIEIREKNTKG